MAWTRPTLFHSARVAGAVLVIALAVLATAYAVAELALVALAIFVAVILTCLLWPLARKLEHWRVPRSVASLLTLLFAIGVAGGVLSWIIPAAISEVSANRDQLAQNMKQLADSVSARLPGQQSTSELLQKAPEYLQKNSQRLMSGVASSVVTATEVVGGLLLALVLTFFFLRDGKRIATNGLGHLSEEKRAVFTPALYQSWKTLRAWIRGAAIIALVDAVGIGVGLAILGVPLALPLAVLTFFAAFIPVVGATVAGFVAILVAWATNGTTDALITLAIVVGVQQLEGNFLEPLVMGRAVPLHPATILVVVTAGGLLAGIPGAFAAVPLAAVGTSFLQEVFRRSEPPHHEAEARYEPEEEVHAPH